MERWRLFRYWTLWMSKRHMVTLHHVITVYNDIFNLMNGTMRAVAELNTQWKKDLYCTLKFVRQKLSTSFREVTPMTGILLISWNSLDPFWKLRQFQKWDRGMDINPEDETSYTTHYLKAFLKCVGIEYCAKHRRLSIIKPENVPGCIPFCPAKASAFVQYSFCPDDLSSDDEEHLMFNSIARTTPIRSDCVACLLTNPSHYQNLLPDAHNNRGQVNSNVINCHSDSIENSFTFQIAEITDWCHQPEDMK